MKTGDELQQHAQQHGQYIAHGVQHSPKFDKNLGKQ